MLDYPALDEYELVHHFGCEKVLWDPYGTNLDNKQYLETLHKSTVIESVVITSTYNTAIHERDQSSISI